MDVLQKIFFDDQESAQDICQKAIDEGVCCECKCTDIELTGAETGVICFYLNGEDFNERKRMSIYHGSIFQN